MWKISAVSERPTAAHSAAQFARANALVSVSTCGQQEAVTALCACAASGGRGRRDAFVTAIKQQPRKVVASMFF